MTSRQPTVAADGFLAALRAPDRAAEEAVLRGTAPDIVRAVPGGAAE
ncbi:hypothetical protein ACFYXJ_11550 [Streptomyces sp. NPDC002667]